MRYLMTILFCLGALALSGCQEGANSSNTERENREPVTVIPDEGELPPITVSETGDTDLSGLWRWSVDPYADGYAGFHGGQAGYGSRRYNFISVEDEMRADPTALFGETQSRGDRYVDPAGMGRSWWRRENAQRAGTQRLPTLEPARDHRLSRINARHHDDLTVFQQQIDKAVGDV